jgi:hypothetical protein
MLIPQLYAETHVGDFTQVRVCLLSRQFIDAIMEAAIGALNEVRIGAQTL